MYAQWTCLHQEIEIRHSVQSSVFLCCSSFITSVCSSVGVSTYQPFSLKDEEFKDLRSLEQLQLVACKALSNKRRCGVVLATCIACSVKSATWSSLQYANILHIKWCYETGQDKTWLWIIKSYWFLCQRVLRNMQEGYRNLLKFHVKFI